MTYVKLLLLVLAAALAITSQAAPPLNVPAKTARESEWIGYATAQFAADPYVGNAQSEYRLADDSRVDVFVVWKGGDRFVIEVERASKWKEAIGQAVFYKAMTEAERGGIILIALGDSTDKQDILRCTIACRAIGLSLQVVDEHGVIR